MSRILSVRGAIRKLRVDRSTLYRWERRGLVKPLRDYRGWRFYRPKDIERLRRWREPKPAATNGAKGEKQRT
jgi:DNA-binding transcriptional MerR regulator